MCECEEVQYSAPLALHLKTQLCMCHPCLGQTSGFEMSTNALPPSSSRKTRSSRLAGRGKSNDPTAPASPCVETFNQSGSGVSAEVSAPRTETGVNATAAGNAAAETFW